MNDSRISWTVAALAALLALAPAAESEAGDEKATRELLSVLGSDGSLFDKAKACQRLAVVGTADAVPVLAGLLSDEKLAHYARFGLEPMPYSAVDVAFRTALGKLEGKLRIGIINSIGARRDVLAEGTLIELVNSPDVELACAAAAAIGRIGTPGGAAALREALAGRASTLGLRLGEAAIVSGEALAAAGHHDAAVKTLAAVRASRLPASIRAAALRGEVLTRGDDGIELLLETIRGDDAVLHKVAFGVARELPGRRATTALVDALDGLPPEKATQVLRALADRGDRSSLPAVLDRAARSGGSVETRVAAIHALAALGDAAAVPRLVEAASGDEAEITEAALATLGEMGGDDVDGATLALLDIAVRRGRGERVTSFLRVLVDVVGRRKISSSVRLLRQAAEHDDGLVRRTAIRSLGTTLGLDEFGALVERLATSKSEEETLAVRDALAMASRRMPSPAECSRALAGAMEGAPTKARAVLLGVFSAVGGPEALEVVSTSARASDRDVRRAAVSTLGAWPHESAVFELLALLPELEDPADRIATFESFHSIVRRLGFDRNRRISACVEAMRIANTDEERRLTIGAFEGIPAPRTLELLSAHLDSETIADDVASAMVTIGERLIRTRQRGAVAPAMKLVLAATENPEIVRRAKQLTKQAGGR